MVSLLKQLFSSLPSFLTKNACYIVAECFVGASQQSCKSDIRIAQFVINHHALVACMY